MVPHCRVTSAGHFETMKGAYVQGAKCPTILCYMSTDKNETTVWSRNEPHRPTIEHHIYTKGDFTFSASTVKFP